MRWREACVCVSARDRGDRPPALPPQVRPRHPHPHPHPRRPAGERSEGSPGRSRLGDRADSDTGPVCRGGGRGRRGVGSKAPFRLFMMMIMMMIMIMMRIVMMMMVMVMVMMMMSG